MIKGLPDKLKSLRIKHNFSQKQIANKLGVTPTAICSYENGNRTPSAETLLALSYIYHCSVDYLLGKVAVEKPNYDGLTEKQSQAINTLIEELKK